MRDRDQAGPATEQALIERLSRLEDRRAIEDVVHRYCRALDRADIALFRSNFWEDGGFGPGRPTAVARDFAEPLMAAMTAKYAATHHAITTMQVDLRGDRASGETYAIVHHRSVPTAAGNAAVLGAAWIDHIDVEAAHDLVIGVRYIDRLERRGGEWRIALRTLIFDWSQVQPSNVRHFGSFTPDTPVGRRGREDLSYGDAGAASAG
ncbi:nuclear transport factor 2 family protein [Sphingobium amiense]|uniref:Nuclear transport factor 2 family protein n=1 Tax=Sphingobium amiense TaxID=135719 RepID=A0A494W7A2_9SPHN|nr:nuclear transport factor 2 family protein [Sphingobium amiense]BBD98427.1 nuclear transport factor 2 family protein [Sphingobium amiense]